MNTTWPLGLLLLAAALLTGCPDAGVVCRAGTNRCGSGCADYKTDRSNCGGCGIACQTGQQCLDGACVCQTGSVPCDGACVVTVTDPRHCGACGNVCPSTQVCEGSTCKVACSLGATNCSGACIDVTSDLNNCGSCGKTCTNAQSCRNGKCAYDLIAACYTSGQVTGIQAAGEVRGPLKPVGTSPASMVAAGNTLLVLDGTDNRLYQSSTDSLEQQARFNKTGAAPNQVVSDNESIYVVNSGSGTLQVLRATGELLPDGGGAAGLGTARDGGLLPDAGLGLTTVAEVNFGTNTYPEGVVRTGSTLWVPLYGGVGGALSGAGQKVVLVDISNPANPKADAGVVDLSTLDLKAFDGGHPVARPYAITTHKGFIYVVLSNLDPDSYAPAGPGLLAKIDPATRAVSVIDLGADVCLNPVWAYSDGTRLYVSCAGAAQYSGPPNYNLIGTNKAAIVAVENDQRVGSWTPSCPAAADGGSGCTPILPSRFTVKNQRLYVGDQAGGRVFVLDVSGPVPGERRGYFGDAGQPISACVADPITGNANVSDVYAVP